MFFWLFMFICNLLIPILMIFAGRMMWKHCPKEINGIYGYRTKRSSQNKDTWNFAHEYCGKLWWKTGLIMLPATIIVFLPFINSSDNILAIVGSIPCTVQCIILIATIFVTESALKKNFTEDGIRKSNTP